MKPYYAITKKIYGLEQANEWDYATLAAIATFNYPFVIEDEKVTEIKVQPFSADDIMSRLRLDSKNKQRHITKIEASIDKLEKAGAIKISRKLDDLYFISQIISYKSSADNNGETVGFANVLAQEFFNICEIQRTNDRIQAVALYVSINQRIFRENKKAMTADYARYCNWETLENLGKKYGRSRTVVLKSLKHLQIVKAISFSVVKMENKNKEESNLKYVMSRYDNNNQLNSYVAEKKKDGLYKEIVINTKYMNNTELKDVEYFYDENDKELFNGMKRVAKETVQPVVNEVADDVATEQLQTLVTDNTDEVVRELTEQVETVDTVEKKEDKQKVININDDERIKRMQALASFENVKNVDEREEESKASVDLLAGHRPVKKTATV
ncbi:hypothetical protein [Pseudolactococcus raffinolactis]|uniref:hypothetical protein n=1 Tax=Pseudolactococcus raffinolactis TaxID=1366 RepID=UPI00077B9C81|nr:hypothetical protein [Lactococcus raffinolactis]PCS11144.1 hypothetical protein RU88_GL000324 [Lactococcus raffinolactis]HBZ60871.1 hypothetical protein [Lactococcus sp.]